MNLLVWIAFGAIAGYTACYLSPVDRSIGASGQMILGIVGAMIGGLVGGVVLGVNPFGLRVDMAALSTAVTGAVVAVVSREEGRQRQLARATLQPHRPRR
jgi:uncharacterized membrane protein YeaQ/YmgE (transglycosylase-associated protein family)